MPSTQSVKCSLCGNDRRSYRIQIDKFGTPICDYCLSARHIRLCAKCGLFKPEQGNKPWGFIDNVGTCCPDCVADMLYCQGCNHYVHELFDGPNTTKICERCKKCTKVCSECGHLEWNDCGKVYEQNYFCNRCFERKFRQCRRCQEYHPVENVVAEGAFLYCQTCYPIRHLIIHNHSYRPEWKMCGRPTRTYFGVELEVECKNIDDTLKVVGIEKGDRIAKHDGSIHHGFEIVSAPCTLRYHQRRFGWRKLCAALRKVGCASDKTTTCGLHVHMTKLFSKMEELRFSAFMYHHIEFLRTLARRLENRYCFIPENIWDRLLKERRVNGDRYEMINWVNESTVEFRLPRGTLQPSVILATIELCDAVIHYTREKNLIQIRKENISQFIAWLYGDKRSRSMYSHLIMFCQRHEEVILDPTKRKITNTRGQPQRRRNLRSDPEECVPPEIQYVPQSAVDRANEEMRQDDQLATDPGEDFPAVTYTPSPPITQEQYRQMAEEVQRSWRQSFQGSFITYSVGVSGEPRYIRTTEGTEEGNSSTDE